MRLAGRRIDPLIEETPTAGHEDAHAPVMIGKKFLDSPPHPMLPSPVAPPTAEPPMPTPNRVPGAPPPSDPFAPPPPTAAFPDPAFAHLATPAEAPDPDWTSLSPPLRALPPPRRGRRPATPRTGARPHARLGASQATLARCVHAGATLDRHVNDRFWSGRRPDAGTAGLSAGRPRCGNASAARPSCSRTLDVGQGDARVACVRSMVWVPHRLAPTASVPRRADRPMTEPHTRSAFDIEPDPAHEARQDAEAEADLAAGRTVPHAEVIQWLEPWGTPNERPCPEPERRWTGSSGRKPH